MGILCLRVSLSSLSNSQMLTLSPSIPKTLALKQILQLHWRPRHDLILHCTLRRSQQITPRRSLPRRNPQQSPHWRRLRQQLNSPRLPQLRSRQRPQRLTPRINPQRSPLQSPQSDPQRVRPLPTSQHFRQVFYPLLHTLHLKPHLQLCNPVEAPHWRLRAR